MNIMPELEQIRSYVGRYRVYPVSTEILSDMRTPLEVLLALQNVSDHVYLLESVSGHENWGRYTFLGYDPKLEITCQSGILRIRTSDAKDTAVSEGSQFSETKVTAASEGSQLSETKVIAASEGSQLNETRVTAASEGSLLSEAKATSASEANLCIETNDPGNFIRRIIAAHRSPKVENLPPFTGGLVGYFSYDYLKYAEPGLRLDAEDGDGFNDVDLMLFDKVIVFDNYRQKMILIVNMELPEERTKEGAEEAMEEASKEAEEDDFLKKSYQRACLALQEMADLVKKGRMMRISPGKMTSPVQALFSEEQFCGMVENAKRHIFEGDIFQVVLSNRLEARYEGSLLNTYRILRTVNPSPYMFYFASSDLEVAGASPETLVKLEDGVLYTFPLAGTRPRGRTPEEDQALEQELLADPKELAEHSMLVDLGRNDIGKIAEYGSVEVEKAFQVERFSHVMHIGSTVRGRISEDKDALDAVASILPAGTLSGAPKIRAMQIIDDLENNKRGIYGGALGYLSLTGNLDLCIAIRIAYKKNGKVYIRSGAGIVADSDPRKEYQECLNKARAVLVSLEKAQEEL